MTDREIMQEILNQQKNLADNMLQIAEAQKIFMNAIGIALGIKPEQIVVPKDWIN